MWGHRPSLPKDRALSFEFLVMFSLVSFQAISVLAQIPLSIANTIYWSIGDLSSSSNNLPIANTLQKLANTVGSNLRFTNAIPQCPDWDLWVQIPRIQLYGFSPIGVSVAPPPSYI